jgi:methionyl-tRNA formyltransferase
VPKRGSLNVHASLLPRHRGASPIAAAILAGDAQTGVTIMEVVRALDAGPMLARVEVPIAPEDTTGTLEPKVAVAGAGLLVETLGPWFEGTLQAEAQDESLVTYAPQIRREDARIDWALPAEEIWRRVRAYMPWPVAFTTWRGEEMRVLEAWPLDRGGWEVAGTVVTMGHADDLHVPADTFAVQTSEGRLAVLRLQRPGKRSVTGSEFLRGQRDLIGQRLGE